MKCCEKYFSEKEILRFIHKNGHNGTCKYCKSDNVKMLSLKEVGSFIKYR